MAFRFLVLGAVSLIPLGAYAQDAVPELPDFEVELPSIDLPSIDAPAQAELSVPDIPQFDEPAEPSSEAAVIPEIAIPDLEIATPDEAPQPIPDLAFEEATPQDVADDAVPEDPFADLGIPELDGEEGGGITPEAPEVTDVALPESNEIEAELAVPDIPDIALEDAGSSDLPDFEAALPELPLIEDVAQSEVPALPTTPDGLPLVTLPPLPGGAGEGQPPITFGAVNSGESQKAAKQRDPNKKYAGKMPRNPAKTSIKSGFDFKRQYVPNEMYKAEYRRENHHLPVVQTVQQYERAFFKAAMENRVADMRALHKHLRTVALRAENGVTPLMAAASAGSHDAVVYLLQHGADRNAVNFSGSSAADYARNDRVMLGLLGGEYYVVSELAE